jgi:hypothetical protein
MLNDSLQFSSLPPDVQSAFIGRSASKLPLQAGTKLYKFTSYPLYGPRGITPWWSAVAGFNPQDAGLDEQLKRSAGLGVDVSQFARARSAVTQQWNSMSGLLIAQLTQPVYGFIGRCAAQPMDEQYGNKVVWIGGAWQAYIPNLTSQEIVSV